MSSVRGSSNHETDEMPSPQSFVALMALERLEDTKISHASTIEPEKVERFRSLSAPFPPGGGDRSFGGHVYAQSAYAASKTVGKGFVVHVCPHRALIQHQRRVTDIGKGYDRYFHSWWPN